jgi:hypothetical protein
MRGLGGASTWITAAPAGFDLGDDPLPRDPMALVGTQLSADPALVVVGPAAGVWAGVADLEPGDEVTMVQERALCTQQQRRYRVTDVRLAELSEIGAAGLLDGADAVFAVADADGDVAIVSAAVVVTEMEQRTNTMAGLACEQAELRDRLATTDDPDRRADLQAQLDAIDQQLAELFPTPPTDN